jgi:hypothetical protein
LNCTNRKNSNISTSISPLPQFVKHKIFKCTRSWTHYLPKTLLERRARGRASSLVKRWQPLLSSPSTTGSASLGPKCPGMKDIAASTNLSLDHRARLSGPPVTKDCSSNLSILSFYHGSTSQGLLGIEDIGNLHCPHLLGPGACLSGAK